MAYRVTLTFVVDTDENEAWEIADGLEKACIKRNYREVNGYAQPSDMRGSVLIGTEVNPGEVTQAETLERRTGPPMGFGGPDGAGRITLGDDDGLRG
jgi:hypothetical protein